MRKIFALLIMFFLLFHCAAVSQDNVAEETQNPQIAELPQVIENHGEMVLVPEGEFLMGSNQDELKSRIGLLGGAGSWYILQIPKHNVTLPAYYIDKYEVTNQQFCEFLNFKGTHQEEGNETPWIMISNRTCLVYQDETGKYRTKEGYENYPAVMVSWYGAQEYAKWAGKRIPTEAEWEKAARGTKGWMWPWGNTWDKNKCNNWLLTNKDLLALMPDMYDGRGPLPVGSFPEIKSSCGALDMAGNAAEWCNEWYGIYPGYPYYVDDNYYEFTHKVTRGGSWGINLPGGLSCPFRSIHRTFVCDSYTGFRCCMDVPEDIQKYTVSIPDGL